MSPRSTDTDTRPLWGRLRFGGRRASAMALAVPLGLLLSAAGGTALALAGLAGPQPLVGGIVIAILLAPPLAGFAWAVVVDRESMRGAVRDPEQSIESAWYQRAASGAFTDVLLVAGLATAFISFAQLEPPTSLALAAVLAFAMIAFCIRYAVERRRG